MSDRKHILFFVPLPPPVHGAAVVSRQIKESAPINEAFECDFINSSTSRSVSEVNHFGLAKPFRYLRLLGKTTRKLLTRRYDLCCLAITCHGKSFLKDAPFVLLCKLFGRKTVIHQHNKGMADDVDRWPYRWLLPAVYKDAGVILLSWRLYDDISRVVPRENVMICPNGIAVTGKAAPARYNAVPRLLFLSNLIESKGVFTLLDALKILAGKGYSFLCSFVGSESKSIDKERFTKEVAERGLDGIVVYHGEKFGEEKERYLEEADVFVFPADNECFSLVLLEAMSHSLPVVTTDEGGIPDIVEDGVNGLICQKRNPESLADCIAKLLEDKDLRQSMGEAGRKRLMGNFTQDHFEKRLIECLQEYVRS